MKTHKEPKVDRVAEAKASLTKALEALYTGEGWKKALDAMATRSKLSVSRLSFRNQLLLAFSGHPSSEPVATFKGWQAVGRCVKKGEKAHWVLAPCPFKKTLEDGTEQGGMYFRAMPMFSLSQTEGEPLPDSGLHCQEVDAQAVPKAFEALRTLALTIPDVASVSVIVRGSSEDIIPNAGGWYTRTDKSIVVVASGNEANDVHTLAHELGHALLHSGLEHHDDRGAKEVEAESVAYVVCRAVGIDTSGFSFPYVAQWAGQEGPAKAALASGERISKAAQKILAVLFPEEEETEEGEAEAAE